MESSKIACLGEGMAVLIPEQPGPLEEASRFLRGVGGAELNVAIALANLGVESAWLSRVGDDGFGRHIVAVAKARGVDVSAVETDPSRPTGLYVKERGGGTGHAHDMPRGASQMHYYRKDSAASAMSRSYLARAATKSVLDQTSILHITGITPALSGKSQRMALDLRNATSARLSVDANWRAILWAGRQKHGITVIRRLMQLGDIVFIGASEASVILGTTQPDQIRAALPEPRWLIIKNDGNEATGFDGPSRCDVPAQVVEIVEPIGAGDAFAAGVLAGMSTMLPLEECLVRGHATAALALRSEGDQA